MTELDAKSTSPGLAEQVRQLMRTERATVVAVDALAAAIRDQTRMIERQTIAIEAIAEHLVGSSGVVRSTVRDTQELPKPRLCGARIIDEGIAHECVKSAHRIEEGHESRRGVTW